MRLIDVDLLITDMGTVLEDLDDRLLTIRTINSQPTVEAAPVVRCDQCVWKSETPKSRIIYCTKSHNTKSKDWFCADGERKETNNGN